MNFEEVKQLIEKIDHSQLTEFQLTMDNISIYMSKHQTQRKEIPEEAVHVQDTIQLKKEEAPPQPTKAAGEIVKAPIVGTFYSAKAPDKPDFVTQGQAVKKGDILCIIEAMKIMNEITSPFDGYVEEIYVKPEQLVEYGQPLFRIV